VWDELAKGAVEGLVHGILSRKADKPSGQVDAQSFVLRDDRGRGRALLTMLEGSPGLTFLNEREQIQALLALHPQGGHLQFWGKDGSTNITVRIEGNEPELVFFDRNDEPRASLRLYASGPCLRLWDSNGKCRVLLETNVEAGPSVIVYDENEEPVQQLRCSE
jgi:hypothetical protein